MDAIAEKFHIYWFMSNARYSVTAEVDDKGVITRANSIGKIFTGLPVRKLKMTMKRLPEFKEHCLLVEREPVK